MNINDVLTAFSLEVNETLSLMDFLNAEPSDAPETDALYAFYAPNVTPDEAGYVTVSSAVNADKPGVTVAFTEYGRGEVWVYAGDAGEGSVGRFNGADELKALIERAENVLKLAGLAPFGVRSPADLEFDLVVAIDRAKWEKTLTEPYWVPYGYVIVPLKFSDFIELAEAGDCFDESGDFCEIGEGL